MHKRQPCRQYDVITWAYKSVARSHVLKLVFLHMLMNYWYRPLMFHELQYYKPKHALYTRIAVYVFHKNI